MMQAVYYSVNRLSLLTWLLFWSLTPACAQPRVANVRAVAQHDTIVITYELVGVQPGEQYAIKAFCWDGYQETALTALHGRAVVGRGTHQLNWRVLAERDLLVGDSITFTIVATRTDSVLHDALPRTTDERKSLMRSRLTAQVDTYLEQQSDQAGLFRDFAERPFESRSGYAKLDEQTQRCNRAYVTLLQNRRTFEAEAGQLWGSQTGLDTQRFFEDLLDKEHRDALKKYNDVLKLMNDVVHGNYKGRPKKALVDEIQTKIYTLTANAETNMARFKTKAADLYRQLAL